MVGLVLGRRAASTQPHRQYGKPKKDDKHDVGPKVWTLPSDFNKPTARPTMRWVFQCFEGIELLHIQSGSTTQSLILRLQAVHQHILALLGYHYQQFYFLSE